LVAESFIAGTSCGGTEFHDFTFQGGSTPEPAPVLFVGVGMMALALFARRRGRNRIAEEMDSNSLND
jgi:MYXO-CTERM domain-containing protein